MTLLFRPEHIISAHPEPTIVLNWKSIIDHSTHF